MIDIDRWIDIFVREKSEAATDDFMWVPDSREKEGERGGGEGERER